MTSAYWQHYFCLTSWYLHQFAGFCMLNLENFSRVIPPDPLAARARPRLRNPRPGIHPPLIFAPPNIDSLETTLEYKRFHSLYLKKVQAFIIYIKSTITTIGRTSEQYFQCRRIRLQDFINISCLLRDAERDLLTTAGLRFFLQLAAENGCS